MIDAHKNFAVSLVATAPSPATSGTSLVVTTGEGTRFPAVPFNATIGPANTLLTPANSEIVRVTAISTDTLTITRAQEGTTARTVVVGDQIAATITAKTLTDVESQCIVNMTAAQDLVAGDKVGVSSLVNNYVAYAYTNDKSVAHGITSPTLESNPSPLLCSIGGDKFVYLQLTTAASDTLFAQVGSVSRANMTITLGTAATVATAVTPGSSVGSKTLAVCKLDTDKFIVFYLLDSSTTAIKYRVGTVSGTTISFGTEATAITSASTVATSFAFGATQISTDKGAFFFKAATTGDGKVVVFTTSGTVATFGTAVSHGANSATNNYSYIKKIGTDKFVTCTNVASANVYAQVFTCVGGTTITSGTEAQISTTAYTATIAYGIILNHTTDAFCYSFPGGAMVCCTVSGTTITAGTTITGITATGYSIRSATQLWGLDTSLRGVGISGTTLTDQGILSNSATFTSPVWGLDLDNGYCVALDPIVSANMQYWIEGMAHTSLGIVQNTASRGSSVQVLIRGVDTNQSGLQAGTTYTVEAGNVLTETTVGGTVNSQDDLMIVRAINSTTVIL